MQWNAMQYWTAFQIMTVLGQLDKGQYFCWKNMAEILEKQVNILQGQMLPYRNSLKSHEESERQSMFLLFHQFHISDFNHNTTQAEDALLL